MSETELQGRRLRSLLDDATGKSEFVIVVVADIRGFSEFSKSHESPDVAMYIKRVYIRLIDKYFPFGNFFKATGDGLLVTIPFDEKTLQEMARKTVESALACHKEFSQICKGDPMVNVETPDRIGIGIARGTACCIVSGDEIVDYSGHLLNLASRLMDIARPSGIVIDGAFGVELLKPTTAKRFLQHDVYVRSVAEELAIRVYTSQDVEIEPRFQHPLTVLNWEELKVTKPLSVWKKSPEYYSHVLPSRPSEPGRIQIQFEQSHGTGEDTWILEYESDDFFYKEVGNESIVQVSLVPIRDRLAEMKIPAKTPVTLSINYVRGPDPP
ncbi:MAG: adenylate/guanylate cyclase domain-containing protein [Chloroflexi bacterium]|nr:adenylate/guanylate cyclase domain-containing protein [Chloroflexota bacterium]